MSTVKVRYTSSKSIRFEGTLDTGIEWEDWKDWTERDRGEHLDDMIWELVELTVVPE